jgi:hypothetical protein
MIGDRERAETRMLAALALDPRHAAWRRELVEWYVRWNRPRESHEQALIGMQLTPSDPESKRAWELTVDTLARGEQGPASLTGFAAGQLGQLP